MNLREKILGLEVRLIGNRVSTLSNTILAGSIVGGIINRSSSLALVSFALLGSLAAYVSFDTDCGLKTKKIYDRTRKHLKRFNKLGKNFFWTVNQGKYSYESVYGYCELQGMYLACRDYSKEALEEFQELKSTYCANILPNF